MNRGGKEESLAAEVLDTHIPLFVSVAFSRYILQEYASVGAKWLCAV